MVKMTTIQQVMATLNVNYKLTTAIQVGMDLELCKILPNMFWSVRYYDFESEYSTNLFDEILDIDSGDVEKQKLFFDREIEIIEDIEYVGEHADFVYIHNRLSTDACHKIYRHFAKNRTPFILVHPDVITCDYSYYQRIRIDGETPLELLYTDLLYEKLSKSNDFQHVNLPEKEGVENV